MFASAAIDAVPIPFCGELRLRRAIRVLLSLPVSNSQFGIRPDYRHRAQPAYFSDADKRLVWQPDVYGDAEVIMRALGITQVIDIGCGQGQKLRRFKDLGVVGIDFGPNLDVARKALPSGVFIEHDIESGAPLDIDDSLVDGSMVICADVIEHLKNPAGLVRIVKDLRERGARCVLISTPERILEHGSDHCGPPPNPCHTREWSQDELASYFLAEGLPADLVSLTRTNSGRKDWHTILAVWGDGPDWSDIQASITPVPTSPTSFRTRHGRILDPVIGPMSFVWWKFTRSITGR